jgi:cathepsin B
MLQLFSTLANHELADMTAIASNDDIVSTVNKHGKWTAHVSPRFYNATNKDVAMLCGSVLSTHADFEELPEAVHYSLSATDLPDSWDGTKDFDGCQDVIGHVRDQSSCGSCWAFGSTEAFNDRRCVAHGDQTFYAAEDTLACCSGLRCGLSMGCNGGQPTSAWKWFAKTGVTTGGDEDTTGSGNTCNPYPFPACSHHIESSDLPECPSDEYSTPKCTESCIDDKYSRKYSEDKVKAKSAYSISGEEKIMEELFTNGPVTGAFTVYEDFTSYKSGVYEHVTGKALGGHAIEIVGYGEEDGVKYWKCKNSWNTLWGDNGFFKIKRGVNECGIEGTVSAGLV